MTSRNQLIAEERNDFRPRQLRCSFRSSQLGFQRHGVKFTATKSWFKTLRHRREEPSKTKDIQHQWPLLGVQHRQDEREPVSCDVLLPARRLTTGKRRVVCQPNLGWQLSYRKRGSASYNVREWLLWVVVVERERCLWRHWYHAEIASDHAYDYLDGA